MTIDVGKYSRAKGNITMIVPKGRRVGGKSLTYKVKLLGEPDDPVPVHTAESEIRKDLANSKIALIPTSPRGGRIVIR